MPRRTDPETVIRSQVVLEEHDVSTDGRFAVVVRRFVHGDRYRSHLWLVPLAGSGKPIQLTSGGVRDSSPRVSPDGTAVAFRRTLAASRLHDTKERASDRDADTSRLRIVPIATDGRPGKPWGIRTPPKRSVGEIAWAPDGSRLALTLDAGPPRFIVGAEPKAGEAPLARRITRIDWRMDETGHVDHWQHVHVVEARAGARVRQVTSGDWGASGIAWSPDGASIAFTADRQADADLTPRTSIWVIDPETGAAVADAQADPREVLGLGGHVHSPAWSPDGRWIAAIGVVEEGALDDASPGLVVGPSDGSAPARPLAPELDRPIGNWVDTDLHGWTASSRNTPCWLDSSTIIALVSDRGRSTPWRFEIDAAKGRSTSAPTPLAAGVFAAHSLAVASAVGVPLESLVTFVSTVDNRPMELLTVPADASSEPATPTIRSRFGSRWAQGLAWPTMHSVLAPGPGGPIETWIASPPDASDTPLPTVVEIHGGPLGAFAPAPFIEAVLLTARGYRVVMPNIRGSQTYGRDWIRPQLGDWGGVDAADVHASIDHVVALGLANPNRLGVLGLSYGGFMVNWLIGTNSRFRAAVSENGVANQISAWANSDTAVEYNRMSLLGTPLDPDGVAKLWRQSPMANVAAIRTPLLMLQGEADMRCPPADNEQLFVALRVLGRTVEYVLYPEESHVYMAAGRPDRRIDRMNRMLDWFDRYLRA
jgi:dipeptidyl aminopeptidase/acylaminoacyl peptidase